MSWLALLLGGCLAAALQELRLRKERAKTAKLTAEVRYGKRETAALQKHLDTATAELELVQRRYDRRLEQSELERNFLQGLVDGVPDTEVGRDMLRRRRERLSLPLDPSADNNTASSD